MTAITPEEKRRQREIRDGKVVSLYKSGMTGAEIAGKFGMTGGNVWHIIKKAGVPLRHRKLLAPSQNSMPLAVGEKVGRWTVTELINETGSVVRVRCECGNESVRPRIAIRNGTSTSCGCGRFTHRETAHAVRSKEYAAWCSMKSRCYDKTRAPYYRYGARGIVVCDEWLNDFQAFLAHVGRAPDEKVSIDRIDNSRGYEPGNVRWATALQQMNNRENSIRITIDGVTKGAGEWAKEAGIHRDTIVRRFRNGMTGRDLLAVGRRRRA